MDAERYRCDAKVGGEAISPTVTDTEDMIMTCEKLTRDRRHAARQAQGRQHALDQAARLGHRRAAV